MNGAAKAKREKAGAKVQRSLLETREDRRAGHVAGTFAVAERKIGTAKGKTTRHVHAVLIGKPVGGRFSSSPAVDVAYRIRRSLQAPDPMPELRRRLRELRGES